MRRYRVTAMVSFVLALGLHAPAWGQDAARHSFFPARYAFSFFDRYLVVSVEEESPGALRLLRGGRGELRVTADAERGIAEVGFDRERSELRLGGLGDGFRYVVVVPPDVAVRVRLPGGGIPAAFDPPTSSALYSWPPEVEAPGSP